MPQSSGGASVLTVVADAFEWGTKVANRYVADFNGTADMFNNATGDLLDRGWRGTAFEPPAPTAATTGDLDSASDAGETRARTNGNTTYLISPKVIGGAAKLDAIKQVTGTRPTTIECWVQFALIGTTDAADTSGIGIASDGDAVLATAGRGYMVTCGATNFELWDGSASTDLGVAKDTAMHTLLFEIDVAGATYRVLLDGTEVKAAAAVTQDIWPMGWNAYQGASGDQIAWYSWGVNYD